MAENWTMESYAETAIKNIREKVGDGKALLALSGGVDSSVACKLLAKAIGSQLTCIFVDHGLMRKNEGDEVEAAFADSGVNFVRVNAGERFLGKLAGVTEPEAKRKIIGEPIFSARRTWFRFSSFINSLIRSATMTCI